MIAKHFGLLCLLRWLCLKLKEQHALICAEVEMALMRSAYITKDEESAKQHNQNARHYHVVAAFARSDARRIL